MAETFEKIKKAHPCFAQGAPSNKGRVHLPVSPGCNIECGFCDRSIHAGRQAPGATAAVITPQEAVSIVRKSVALAPEITVVGIAGPGDTLATDYAFKTFRLIKKEFPELIRCMSTNGLLLDDLADECSRVGVNTLTVTVNDVFPETLALLCERVRYRETVYEGGVAARLLIEKQLAGIKKAADAGILVKINTVLVPGVNAAHIGETARAVSAAGASVLNIIPLIPQNKLAGYAAPTCSELDAARREAERHINVFRHCRHCRADAIGVPGGKDYAGEIYAPRAPLANTFSHG